MDLSSVTEEPKKPSEVWYDHMECSCIFICAVCDMHHSKEPKESLHSSKYWKDLGKMQDLMTVDSYSVWIAIIFRVCLE